MAEHSRNRSRSPGVAPSTSDQAVAAASGKTWPQWFRVLDQAGAESWNHKQIVQHLREGYPLNGWWRQMVAVTYEQARGLRDKHEQPDGYQIQRQRTIHADVEAAWRAWTDGRTRVLLGFRPAGDGKCMAGAQHCKLSTRAAAEEAKSDWAARLESLRALLESRGAD